MQRRVLIGSSLLAAIVLTGAACAGTISDDEKFDDVIGAQVELVQKKREWLTGYERHCGVCFEALALCKKGSLDPSDAANCEAALNACVRGGLISDGDAGANSADAGTRSTQSDAGTSDDVDNAPELGVDGALDASDVLNANAGPPDPLLAVDAGPRPREIVIRDASSSDAGIPQIFDPFGRDAGGRGGPASNAGDKKQMEQDVDLCLSKTHDCLGTAANVQSCVSALRGCVRSALEQTFADVCTTQLASCRAQGAAASATRSVERLCRQELDFAPDVD